MQTIQTNFALREEAARLAKLDGNCGRTIRRFFDHNVKQGELSFTLHMFDQMTKIQVIYLLAHLVEYVTELNYARRAYDGYPQLLLRCFDLENNCFRMGIDDIQTEGTLKEKQMVLEQITDLVWHVQPDCDPLRNLSDAQVLAKLLRESGYTEDRTPEEFAKYCEMVYAELIKYLDQDPKATTAKIPVLLTELSDMIH